MTDGESLGPEALQVARGLLSQLAPDAASAEAALQGVQTILQGIHGHLGPRIGDGGFRALLQMAHRDVVRTHPLLEQVVVSAEGAALLDETVDTNHPTSGEDLREGLVAFLARVLSSVRDLARDQDWEVVDLWPVLGAFESSSSLDEPPALTEEDRR